MNRGEIWWANFGLPHGSEPGFRRPVLVLQADCFNRSRIQTVAVVPLSSNLDLAAAPGNVRCGPRQTGLKKPSVANVSQISAIDRGRLVDRVSALPSPLLGQIEDGVRLVLGL